MRFSLKDFQVNAADKLIEHLEFARFGVSRNRPQAVVLSSPTGSGKTVIVTEMIERIMRGHDGAAGDPRAVFLWLSDSPELNEQSKAKIEEACDLIPGDRLITIEYPFNVERLSPGRVYFLNTQKLASGSLLTKTGDRQERTIWGIIENTAKGTPTAFYLIIDEAHRGMGDTAKGVAVRKRNENARLTMVQRFVRGDPSIGLSPVPIIVGISATPARFYTVLENTNRSLNPVTVEPEDVRGSGLVKDRIKLATADKREEADWSMLEEAARRWARYTQEWSVYCSTNGIARPVRPLLVVQVENGNERVSTRTDLATCVKVIGNAVGHLPPATFAHCFERDGDEPAGAFSIRKVSPSAIQDDPNVNVVFFKTALTTGWDCPRAEVMMSFRKAVDDTLIAQLVGRMVRTPLAMAVTGNEFLNGVSLALPHYDDAAVATIIAKLQDPETGVVVEATDESQMSAYSRAADKADLFDALVTLPTYVVTRPRRIADTARLRKLAAMLSRHRIGEGSVSRAVRFVVERLLEQRDRLKADPQWAARLEGTGQILVKEFTIEFGLWKLDESPDSYSIDASEENIYGLFERCGGVLGEGLHESYANRPEYKGDLNVARLELFCIVQDERAVKLVQQACEAEFERLWGQHADEIASLLPPLQERFKELRRRGGTTWPERLAVADKIDVRRESPTWPGHLFVDDRGQFGWSPGSWEQPVLKVEMQRPDFAGFLRNIPRKPWALCVPYGSANDKAMYPDLLTFRRTASGVKVDVLEPHGDQFADHIDKARGMARYAAEHGDLFGRIEMIRMFMGKAERLDLQNENIRRKVLMTTTSEQLAELYREHG